MLGNFQTFTNSGGAECFTCVLTMHDGTRWHIYGSRFPHEDKFNVRISHYEPEYGDNLVLLVTGYTHLDCLVRVTFRIARWEEMTGVTKNA